MNNKILQNLNFFQNYEFCEEDSDEETNDSSSGDDINISARGNVKQKKCMQKKKKLEVDEESSSEDEFEKEMARELNQTLRAIETSAGVSRIQTGSGIGSSEQQNFYSADYFDSDSDEEGTREEKKKKKHPVLTNDELFYDPSMDANDQKWVDRQRQRYQPSRETVDPTKFSSGSSVKPLPRSDAVLNCPACMSLLCLDCQRHETYHCQYRAMFVKNCSVKTSEVLRYPDKQQKNKNKRKKMEKDDQPGEDLSMGDDEMRENLHLDGDSDEIYHPVRCNVCNTEVAVYDKEEVYHFYNVLSSYT